MKKNTLVLLVVITFIVGVSLFFWFYTRPVFIKVIPFTQLSGWNTANLKKSLTVFQSSCKNLLKKDPEQFIGNSHINLKVKDLTAVCRSALLIDVTATGAKDFFQKWFSPVEFYNHKHLSTLFTGYYMPLFKGSLIKTSEFTIPLYGLPSNLVTIDLGKFSPKLKNKQLIGRVKGREVIPFYTREQINQGTITSKARVLVWLKSPIDRLFLEIQGSGIISLNNGKHLYIGYKSQNGAVYTAIGSVLIKKGVMSKKTMSMQAIRAYLESHPQEIESTLNQNKSFIFFEKLIHKKALGAQGLALTPGYSLAVDKRMIPLGLPLWINTTIPCMKCKHKKRLQRLMFAQDTGGAISGILHVDVYWGPGSKASYRAGHMKNKGHYWLLIPRNILSRLD